MRSGFAVSVAAVGAGGEFVVKDLPGEEAHLDISLRGGTMPAIMILKVPLPAADDEPEEE